MRRRVPLRPRSDKAKATDAERDRVRRAVLLRAGYRCEAAAVWPEVPCSRDEPDVHERAQRSVRPGAALDPDNCMALCWAHHRAAHDNISLAHERGLLRHSWEGPTNER